MILSSLSLKDFRNYKKASFSFDENLTVIIGPNAIGKSNILEAMYLLSTGKSFRAERDEELVRFDEMIGRTGGEILDNDEETLLEVVIAKPLDAAPDSGRFTKRYFVNKVAKRQFDFAGHLKALLFVPSDLDIVSGSPSLRRRFLDQVLIQTDREYARSLTAYAKALRQRNALLELARETGKRSREQFSYWDGLLVGYGQILTERREGFIEAINRGKKELIECRLEYDKSSISEERLKQYEHAEIASGVTLVGPHRDDIKIFLRNKEDHEAKLFASRGQQRLIVLQLKLLERGFMQEVIGEKPLLLLDDIFSELDGPHIEHVLSIIAEQQTILTTTHEEFLNGKEQEANVITLGESK